MDADGFDSLMRRFGACSTRRGALGQLATMLAASGMVLFEPGSTTAGHRHRRRSRRHRNHDNRKGNHDGGKRKRRQDDPPFYDCTKPDSWGQPCARTIWNQTLRCCNGVCPTAPTCTPYPNWTSVSCGSSDDCRSADAQCCTGNASCDRLEGLCLCGPADLELLCGFDSDCGIEGEMCVCGRCH